MDPQATITRGIAGTLRLAGQPELLAVAVDGTDVVLDVAGLALALDLADVADVLLATYAAAPTGSERDVLIALTAAQELARA